MYCLHNLGQFNSCGHVAICTGECTTSYFYSYDRNWNGKEMYKVKHDCDDVYGVLRPKDQSKISGAPAYKVGGTYTLQTNVKVSTAPARTMRRKLLRSSQQMAKRTLLQRAAAQC